MTSQRLVSSWSVIVAACLTLTACKGSSTQPSPEEAAVAGNFILELINGSLLPAVSAPRPPNTCEGSMTSGRLIMTVDPRTYELRTVTRFDCSNGAGPVFSNDSETEKGTWTLSGGAAPFTMTFTPTGASIYHFTTATATPPTLTIRLDAPHQDAGRPQVFLNTTWLRQ